MNLACRLEALSSAERARRSRLAADVRSSLIDIKELDAGFRLLLPNEPGLSRKALDLIMLERKCCPFLRFELSFELADGPTYLYISGGQGVKEFLKENGLLGCADL